MHQSPFAPMTSPQPAQDAAWEVVGLTSTHGARPYWIDILDMQAELMQLRHEVARLRAVETQYHELLDSSLQHSQQMCGNILLMLMKPGVAEALASPPEA